MPAETQEQFDAQIAANDAVVSDIPKVDGEGPSSPTPSTDGSMTSEQLAKQPDIAAAFEETFGAGSKPAAKAAPKPEAKAKATRPQDQRLQTEEQAEELEGLETDEADDGVPPDGDDDTATKAKADDEQADKSQDKKGDEEADDGAATLNPLLRQAAMRAGMSEKEIGDLYKADPKVAETTFSRFLTAYNQLSAEYGQLGAAHPASQAAPQGPYHQPPAAVAPQPQARPPEQSDVLSQIYGEKLKGFSAEYGENFVADILTPLLEHTMGPVQELMAANHVRELQAVAKEVGTFFGALPGELKELYGDGDQVTDVQLQARDRVGQIADQIRTGAGVRGVQLDITECLGRANMMFAGEHLATLERKKITAQVKKRAQATTARPSQRQRPPASEAEGSDQSAMDAYAQRAQELDVPVGTY